MSAPAADKPLRILQVHNQYYTGLGGEDTVLSLELEMLRKHEHHVQQLIVSTAELRDASPFKILSTALSTPWSVRGYKLTQQAIKSVKPDIVHFHNTFPLLSPSVFWATHAAGIPSILTLHNYRHVCANGVIGRDDAPCEDCMGHLPLPALRHRCYKNSLLATAPIVAMQIAHQALGTMRTRVDAFITLTRFAKGKMVQAGFPGDKIHVKPNFVPYVAQARAPRPAQRQFVFAGTILRYKGLDLLLEAWSRLDPSDCRLLVIGDGACRSDLQRQYPDSDRLTWLGQRTRSETVEFIARSDFVVIPSRIFEGLPMVLLEAISQGTPTIGPNHGAFPELISNEHDGLLFEPNNVDSLTMALRRALSIESSEWSQMAYRCLTKCKEHYTEDVNYRILNVIYEGLSLRTANIQRSITSMPSARKGDSPPFRHHDMKKLEPSATELGEPHR